MMTVERQKMTPDQTERSGLVIHPFAEDISEKNDGCGIEEQIAE